MDLIQKGSYLAIHKKSKLIIPAFCEQFGLIFLEEIKSSFNKVPINKLWKRKSLFSGEIQGLLIQINSWTFFYEEMPSSLFHSEDALQNLSMSLDSNIYNFYFYPSAKSCGFKAHQNGKNTRHIESEIDYSVVINQGKNYKFEVNLFSETTLFDQANLSKFITELQIPLISNWQNSEIQTSLCIFKR